MWGRKLGETNERELRDWKEKKKKVIKKKRRWNCLGRKTVDVCMVMEEQIGYRVGVAWGQKKKKKDK